MRLGEVLADVPEVAEIDLNTVVLDAAGAHPVDARVILEKRGLSPFLRANPW